jgi:hypothetical protein
MVVLASAQSQPLRSPFLSSSARLHLTLPDQGRRRQELNYVLIRYALERFLLRLSSSAHRDTFILGLRAAAHRQC